MSALNDLKNAPLHMIALEIFADWTKMSPHARPYAQAMTVLDDLNDKYIADSALSIVCYFLSNAAGWRGEVAKAVKAELKRRVAEYEKAHPIGR